VRRGRNKGPTPLFLRKERPGPPKREASAEMAAHVAEFLAAGNRIDECAPQPNLHFFKDYYPRFGIGRTSFVYFIQAGQTGPIKIGVAYDPVERLAELQVGNHEELRIVGLQLGTPSDEQLLHKEFASNHIRGEWFRLCDRLATYIKRATQHTTMQLRYGGFDEIELPK